MVKLKKKVGLCGTSLTNIMMKPMRTPRPWMVPTGHMKILRSMMTQCKWTYFLLADLDASAGSPIAAAQQLHQLFFCAQSKCHEKEPLESAQDWIVEKSSAVCICVMATLEFGMTII
jgi:hypothetical protein